MNNIIGILISIIILAPFSFSLVARIIIKSKAVIYTPNEIRESLGMWAIECNKPQHTNCPNCGAAVDIRSDKCEYCGTPYIKNIKTSEPIRDPKLREFKEFLDENY